MKKKLTAAELMARLNSDPDYVARKKEQDERFRRQDQEYARAEAPLVQDLRSCGLNVDSVWDLVNDRTGPSPRALPILLDHLQRKYPDAIRDGIARAMAIPAARSAWTELVKLYQQEQGVRTKDGLAVALSNIADDDVIGDLIALACDTRHGVSRVLLLDALKRSHLPRARKALMQFGADPLLQKEAQRILRLLRRAKR